jgi:alkylhydroperoxidase/carboxymuconolactone decarboxylase family protein YurZ
LPGVGKAKELIAVAARCDNGSGFHIKTAVDRGATRVESSKRRTWRSI